MAECSVECPARWREVQPPDESRSLLCAMLSVHMGIFPFDRKRPLIARQVERPDHALEVDSPSPRGSEIPEATRLPELAVPAKDAGLGRLRRPPHVLDV